MLKFEHLFCWICSGKVILPFQVVEVELAFLCFEKLNGCYACQKWKTKNFLEFPKTIKYLFCYSKIESFIFYGGFISLLMGVQAKKS